MSLMRDLSVSTLSSNSTRGLLRSLGSPRPPWSCALSPHESAQGEGVSRGSVLGGPLPDRGGLGVLRGELQEALVVPARAFAVALLLLRRSAAPPGPGK